MRINRYVASATGMSRRAADEVIKSGRVTINQKPAGLGDTADTGDEVALDGRVITQAAKTTTVMLNKPEGYVCSRNGQGSMTIYELLPAKYHRLKPIGRLDKDSSGLMLLSDDGELANKLTHPRHQKEKVYRVKLNKSLSTPDKNKLLTGVKLKDGLSKFIKLNACSNDNNYEVILGEGRNRQIRRSFNALGYKTLSLHRLRLGKYDLDGLSSGKYKEITA